MRSFTRGNRGEWAEVLAKLYFGLKGSFYSAVEHRDEEFESIVLHGVEHRPLRTLDTHLWDLFYASVARLRLAGRGNFELVEAVRLGAELGFPLVKSDAQTKEDIVLCNQHGHSEAFFVENTRAAGASFVNASSATKITFLVENSDGSSLTATQRASFQGTKAKTLVRLMSNHGVRLHTYGIENADFAREFQDLGCIVADYLMHESATVADVLEIHRTHTDPKTFIRHQDRLLRYIVDCIFAKTPTGDRKESDRDDDVSTGAILFDHASPKLLTLYRASGYGWWPSRIKRCARFDTPSTTKHNHGYLFERDGKTLFNFALGIRGSLKDAVKL